MESRQPYSHSIFFQSNHFNPQNSPQMQQRKKSREESRSISESFSEGTSKFFNSVIAKKNDLFHDIGKQITTSFPLSHSGGVPTTVLDNPQPPVTTNVRRTSDEQHVSSCSPNVVNKAPGVRRFSSSSSSRDENYPVIPPPRPPLPIRRPSIDDMREKERVIKRTNTLPANSYYDFAASFETKSKPEDSSLPLNGINTSSNKHFRRKSAGIDNDDSIIGAAGDENCTSSDAIVCLTDTLFKSDINEITAQMMVEAMNKSRCRQSEIGRPDQHARSNKIDTSHVVIDGSDSKHKNNMCETVKGVEHKQVNSHSYQEKSTDNLDMIDNGDDGKENSGRYPKLTSTKRRSSTVDEMLFDNYVETTIDPESVFVPKELPANLMSFDSSNIPKVKKSTHHPSGQTDKGKNSSGSVESSDLEYGRESVHRSVSIGSYKSWSSNYSIDTQPDDVTMECMDFMKKFVDDIFTLEDDATQVDKAKFGELCQCVPGRLWFARYINSQRVNEREVLEPIFFRLVQYMTVCLFECNEAEDFSPAKTLMNMCFTFHCDIPGLSEDNKNFLYVFLKDHPIWQSLRFWNAAFFDAVQRERSRRPIATNSEEKNAVSDDQNFLENITFGQLGTFTCNMRAFGLSRDLCLEFLRKQCTIADLSTEQMKLLKDSLDKRRQ